MELDVSSHDAEQHRILEMMKVEASIQAVMTAARYDYEHGGQGFAKKSFSIPRRLRASLTLYDEYQLRGAIEGAIAAADGVRGFATVWAKPSLIFPGNYSITLLINT